MGPAVHIHRWRNEYIVAREHPAVEEVRSCLDRIGEHVPGELCAGLERWSADRDDSVVLLNRVVFDCELDLSRDSWLLASRWAYRFATALIRAVDTECDGILCFPSAAAFRAQFIADLSAGRAWNLWYYRPFRGLEALPASAAIRTLLLEDAGLGCATIRALSGNAWMQLASVLTRIEALRILHGLSDTGEAGPELVGLAPLLARSGAAFASAPWFVRALRMFADALAEGFSPTTALAGIVRLAAKIPLLRLDSPKLVAALDHGDVEALVSADPERDLETWAALVSRSEWRPVLAEAVRRATNILASKAPAEPGYAFTFFGGLSMLLPELDALFSGVSAVLPRSGTAGPRAIAAWLTFAHCVGSNFTSTFLNEGAWREFFGVAPRMGGHEVREWLEGGDASAALDYLAGNAANLARGDRVLIPVIKRRALVDRATHIWMSFSEEPTPAAASWRERLAEARLARADWRYFQPLRELPALWELFFRQAAQIVLRRFAYRMPGFSGASLPYLWTNFLMSAGQWDTAAGLLRLSRPPLHTLLQLTGASRGEIRWSGPPARVVRLEFVS